MCAQGMASPALVRVDFLDRRVGNCVWQWSKGSVTGVGRAGDGRAYGLSAGVYLRIQALDGMFFCKLR